MDAIELLKQAQQTEEQKIQNEIDDNRLITELSCNIARKLVEQKRCQEEFRGVSYEFIFQQVTSTDNKTKKPQRFLMVSSVSLLGLKGIVPGETKVNAGCEFDERYTELQNVQALVKANLLKRAGIIEVQELPN